MSKSRKRAENNIDFDAEEIAGEEQLARLLCSPQYYDTERNIVNNDAFDLRILKSGVKEQFVSLGRLKFMPTEKDLDAYLTLGERIKWPDHDPKNVFSAYGEFNCGDAREVHDMVRIHPLKGDNKKHIGLFYAKHDGGYFEGPLPKTDTDVLEVLSDLADLVSVRQPTASSHLT